ncbi:cytochrome c oxidase subunit II [Azohydromonas aeria]|uniref:cytochrome c oxidase subunit II n=1 Tax=Azohydromonas aeria TaxID=2590212 RepID=UPI0018DFC61E|nr:cytochrome c oxidase subunit II [Azohydromonas aeria]
MEPARRQRPFPAWAAAAALLGGCAGEQSALAPAGPAAQAIAGLWWAMLIGAAALFTLTMALLAAAFLRRRAGAAATMRPGPWLVGGGLVLPALVLSALLAFALATGERLLPRPGADVVTVQARAAQWAWTFSQQGPGGTIERVGTLDIPAGRPVDLRLSSADVIHSFWVPRLAGKLDAIPGRVNTLRIEAAEPGVYPGQCAEFCGSGHARMRVRVVVHDAAGWAAFLQGATP